jgi:DNA uptake protein ComE-like DNA-binding protein
MERQTTISGENARAWQAVPPETGVRTLRPFWLCIQLLNGQFMGSPLARSGTLASASNISGERQFAATKQRFMGRADLHFSIFKRSKPTGTKASILVGLLWCLALLSVVVISVLYTARLDLLVVKNYGDTIQAHYLALAGIEKAKALLYHDAIARKRSSQNHTGKLYDAPQDFRDVPLGRGQFRVFRQGRPEEGGRVICGISDEESRLNANLASADELRRLNGMTPEVAAAILDWRDEDSAVTPGGAEAEYYAGLQPPCLARNGPLQTIRELLMVRGVTHELLLGEDVNQNGLLDADEDDGNNSYPLDNRDGILDAGWAGSMTVDSSVQNANAAGEARINIQSADESSLGSVRGISSDLAKAIVAYRGQNRLESLADLLEVVAVKKEDQSRSQASRAVTQADSGKSPSPQNIPPPPPSSTSPSGEKLVSEDLLMDIADDLTAESGQDLPGVININTAGPVVLACLPGIDHQLAEAIVSYRQSSGFFPNIAWLLKVPGMNRQVFKQVAPRVSARSETFRILSEGKVGSTGARKRIQVIVRIGAYDIETLSFREDL